MGQTSVADPNLGFGVFYPRIQDPGGSNGRIRIRDKQAKSVTALYKTGRTRDPVLFYPADPGSGRGWSDDKIGIRDKNYGSATLGQTNVI
jgi:hypothetical protein